MSSKLLSHRKALCNQVSRIAVEAGAIILEYFDGIREMSASEKSDGSPVTCADQAGEKYIQEKLKALCPEVPFIGEESYANGAIEDIALSDYFWLVDPLDGTKSFLRGESEFTVNIALIYKHVPVMGVIYVPEKGELYKGFTEESGATEATRYFEDSDKEKSLQLRSMKKEGLLVVTGGDHKTRDSYEEVLGAFKIAGIKKQLSSLKFCTVADAKADLYLRLGPICEWDIAAGHAILKASGGDVRDLSGNSLTYGHENKSFYTPHFIAASEEFFVLRQQAEQIE